MSQDVPRPEGGPESNPSLGPVDFGRTAEDYARHRPGFPESFFDWLGERGLLRGGERILDLGTGTGTLARGFARRGAAAVGVDLSQGMLDQASALAAEEDLRVSWLCAKAEFTQLPSAHFDLVTAGQSWHWFDRPRAASEVARMLRPGGFACIAYFSYLVDSGSVGEATEALVLRHNPAWTFAGDDGRHPECANDLLAAGLMVRETLDVELPVTFTHESWRGRFRACNGVLTQAFETIAAFDAALAHLLERQFPEPVVSNHRLYAVLAERV